MEYRKIRNGTGAGMLGVGMAFWVVALSGQPAHIGIAMAFIALGIVFLASASKRGCP